MKGEKALAGQPFLFPANGIVNYWVCCDCGLTHAVVMEVVDENTVKVIMFRDEHQTRLERKARRKK